MSCSASGFLIFQEQIAMLAHKLGKNLNLDEGNKLRKLLTKKGTGSALAEKDKIYVPVEKITTVTENILKASGVSEEGATPLRTL